MDNENTTSVLVIDDTPENIDIAVVTLTKQYHVKVANALEQALEIAERTPPDLVLLDVEMPGMDTFELCKRIKTVKHCKDVPVIFMTSLSATEDKLRGFEAGAIDYVTKPIDPSELSARVKLHIELACLRREVVAQHDQLDQASQARARLMRTVRNDLTNYGMAIGNNCEFLENIMDTGVKLSEMHSKIQFFRKIGDHLLDLVDHYIDSEEVQDLFEDVTMEDIDVDAMIEAIREEFLPFASEKQQRILFFNKWQRTLRTDRSILYLAIKNLLTNAIKYSYQEQNIEISVVGIGDEAVQIRVRDHGPGVKPKERDILFTEFGKTSNKPTNEESNLGIGLWLCKQSLERVRGKLGADFPESGGSVFYVEIPYAQG